MSREGAPGEQRAVGTAPDVGETSRKRMREERGRKEKEELPRCAKGFRF